MPLPHQQDGQDDDDDDDDVYDDEDATTVPRRRTQQQKYLQLLHRGVDESFGHCDSGTDPPWTTPGVDGVDDIAVAVTRKMCLGHFKQHRFPLSTGCPHGGYQSFAGFHAEAIATDIDVHSESPMPKRCLMLTVLMTSPSQRRGRG